MYSLGFVRVNDITDFVEIPGEIAGLLAVARPLGLVSLATWVSPCRLCKVTRNARNGKNFLGKVGEQE
jgi:hypothetical protein